MSNYQQQKARDLKPVLEKLTKIGTILFGGFLVLFGLVFLFIFFNVTKVSRAQQSWLKTDAEVIKTDIKVVRSEMDVIDEKAMREKRRRNNKRQETLGTKEDVVKTKKVKFTNYAPEIFYKYEVDGNSFRGRKYRTMGYSDNDRNKIKDLLTEYPAGKKIEVFYNPENLKEAAIEKAPPPSYFLFILGSILIIFGVLFAMFGGKVFMMMLETLLKPQQ
ncbi:MAG: DUF3592 domain-containing protein [Candidatus Rifleibacteriota bacterium]